MEPFPTLKSKPNKVRMPGCSGEGVMGAPAVTPQGLLLPHMSGRCPDTSHLSQPRLTLPHPDYPPSGLFAGKLCAQVSVEVAHCHHEVTLMRCHFSVGLGTLPARAAAPQGRGGRRWGAGRALQKQHRVQVLRESPVLDPPPLLRAVLSGCPSVPTVPRQLGHERDYHLALG